MIARLSCHSQIWETYSGGQRSRHQGAAVRYTARAMAVTVDMQNTGDARVRTEVVAMIQHMLSDRPGPWRVSIFGSQANDRWDMSITGPKGFERSYTLEGSAGEHRAEVIRVILGKMLPAKNS
jgi:hypothetical protein